MMRGSSRGGGKRGRLVLLLPVLVVAIVLATAGVALADQWRDISDSTWTSTYGVTAQQAATVSDGYNDRTFRPAQAVTRGQFAKFAVDGFGVATSNPATPTFRDVARGSTFYTWIQGGVAAGLISGFPDNTFRPNSTITRQQANNILGSYLSKRELAEKGSITGSRGTYQTLKQWYDAEGSAILAQFRDAASVVDPHRQGTAYLAFRQVVQGSGTAPNLFLMPNSSLTRAQAVVMVLRVKGVSLASPYTAGMTLALTSPAVDAYNTINVVGTGGTRTATVNVGSGTTAVVLTGFKSATQTVTGGGADRTDVTAGGTATAQTYTVNTTSVASGGSKTFTLTLSEEGKQSIVYTVTVNVVMGLNLTLTAPAPSPTNTISTTGGGAAWIVNVRVVNGTNSVVLTGSKSATQTVTIAGPHSALVALGGSVIAPTYTVDTSAIAVAGGTRQFTLTLSEPGKTSILYTVTVTVGPEFTLTLTTPPPSTENTLTMTGSATSWDVGVLVINGTGSVVLTGSKSASQTVVVGGVNAGSVTPTGTATAPIFTIDTDSIRTTGGTRSFTITIKETGKTDVVFNVSVTVRAMTTHIPWVLTTPAPIAAVNTIEHVGASTTRTVNVKVANGTTSVVLTGAKAVTQTLVVSGQYFADAAVGGSTTSATLTLNMTTVAVSGGDKVFTVTVGEANKSSIVYTVNVTVAGLTQAMSLALTTPAAALPNNTISLTGTGATRTVAVSVANGFNAVVLTGTKTVDQAVVVGGANAADVIIGGSSIAPAFTVNTTAVAAAGGSKVFTITLSEGGGKGSIVYTVTVTVLGPLTADMALNLTTPSPSGVPGQPNELISPPETTGDGRTVAVNVINGVNSVVLTGIKSASQTVTIGGTNAANVTAGGTSTVPIYTVNTSTVSTGGTRVFTLTVSETGKSSKIYTVTVTVGALTEGMTLALLSPALNPPKNTFSETTPSPAVRTVAVKVENTQPDLAQVVLKGVKTAVQHVVIGGTNGPDVTLGGSPPETAPEYILELSPSVRGNGGTMTYTLTLSETGKGTITYNVTVTVDAPYTTPLTSLAKTGVTPITSGVTIGSITGTGGARTVQIDLDNGTTEVVLTAGKLTSQTLTESADGVSIANGVTGAGTGSPTITVSTSGISSGGTRTFAMTLAQTGQVSIVYTVTVNVGGRTQALISLVLDTPPDDENSSIAVTGSLAERTVTVTVRNPTSEVKLKATKLITQTLTKSAVGVSIANGGTGAGTENPIITVDTSAISSGGTRPEFNVILAETGKSAITYRVTVTVVKQYTAELTSLVLTSPTGTGNSLGTITGAYGNRAVTVDVVNGVTQVRLTAGKATTQSLTTSAAGVGITSGGTGAGTTSPVITIDTNSIKTGDQRTFTMTLSQGTDFTGIVYTVTVKVAGQTAPMTFSKTSTTPVDPDWTLTGGGDTSTVTAKVANGTTEVRFTGTKDSEQGIVISGDNATDVSVSGESTASPVFKVNTSGVAANGGTKVFTINLTKSGESPRAYSVTVAVGMPGMAMALTSPLPGAWNTISGGGSNTTVRVNVVNGLATVQLTGTKTIYQSVSVGGTHGSSVAIGGPSLAPTFAVTMGATIATYGGTREFTITLSQAGMTSITYNVTVTVKPLTEAMTFSKLGLVSPGTVWTIVDSGTTPTRPVTVNVPNGTTKIRILGAKKGDQSLAKSGTYAGDVNIDETVSTAPIFEIDTDSISGGGVKTFTITLSENGGYGSITYQFTVTVAP